MEGQILGNRYELLEKIGGGGMAIVYKARCQLLNRYVAVKILRPEFTNDEEFVKRFKVESQSAASLSHPNIVSIYDVGHEGSIHYIVMEYIDGITLKEYITQKGALKWKEAVNIAIQICSAIEHAHRNHIVHRDIKPHNIMITNDHIAKVTDFGIARAVSSSTITMVGSTIGSVHYFSPEQARGGFTDEKSDLYSIGIALYEMVTGRVPFDGETPVAIALKHIQVEPQPPIEINPNIPRGINDIILKAIKKEQNKRYQNAADMINDLYAVMKDPEGEFASAEDDGDAPTRRVKVINESEIEDKNSFFVNQSSKGKMDKKKKDLFTYLIVGASALILMVVLFYVSYRVVTRTTTPDEDDSFTVENYVNEDIDDVKAALAKYNLNIKEKREYNKDVEKDKIISQGTNPGYTLKKGGNLELVISDGPKVIKMIELKNAESREAQLQIEDMGLVPVIQEENNDTVAYGQVIRTDPDVDTELQEGDTVTIFKSIGPKLVMIRVPNLTGMTQQAAKETLVSMGLKVGKVFPEGQSSVVAKVVNTYPKSDTEVPNDSAVDLYMEEDRTTESVVMKNLNINLKDPENYGDVVNLRVEVTRSDTNNPEYIINVDKAKGEFPVSVSVPVPVGGSTTVSVFIDNMPYGEDIRFIG